MSNRDLDKFYTNTQVVKSIIDMIDTSLYDVIIEPSAGSGAFYIPLRDKGKHVLAYDIKPDHPDIKQLDFLNNNIDISKYNRALVIGNPPFGKQASLASKFFNKCASYDIVDTIAMVLPKSFKKISIQKRLDRHFDIVIQKDLPSFSFLFDNNPYDVPCIVQIWNRLPKPLLRQIPTSDILCDKLKFTKTPLYEPNIITIRRVGVYAGRTFLFQPNTFSPQSHYYLQVHTSINIKTFIDKLNQVKWEYNDTTGPRSISKHQLIPLLNSLVSNI